MRVILKTKNLEFARPLDDFVKEKFESIKKFIDILKREEEVGKTPAEVFVEVKKETMHHKKGKIFIAEVQVRLPGRTLFAKAQSDDLLSAIVGVKNELKTEIEKYKLKNIDKNRREVRKLKRKVL